MRMIEVLARAALCLLVATSVQAGDWTVERINGKLSVGNAMLSFAPDGRLTGSTGCNRLNSTVRYDAGVLVFDAPLALTRMACPDEGLMEQENAITVILQDEVLVSFDPVAGEMTLARDALTLVLAPAEAK